LVSLPTTLMLEFPILLPINPNFRYNTPNLTY
jgi:hypothetical protein